MNGGAIAFAAPYLTIVVVGLIWTLVADAINRHRRRVKRRSRAFTSVVSQSADTIRS